jgi:hypothetical protein
VKRTSSRLAVIGIIALVALLAVPSGAGAAPPVYHDNERFGPDVHPGEDICGIAATLTISGHFNSKARPVKGAEGQAFFASNTFQVTEVWSTSAGSLSIVHKGSFREKKATKVPGAVTYENQEGDLVTSDHVWLFQFQDAGNFRVFGEDGRLLLKANGVFRAQEQFDTLGDLEPGGEPVPGTFEVLREQTGRSFSDDQFCSAVLAQLT